MDKKNKLKNTEAKIEEIKSDSVELEKKSATIKEETKKLQTTMAELASALQKKERELITSEHGLLTINANIKLKEEKIAAQKKQLSTYTHTLLRLGEMPPEAMVMLPEISVSQIEAASALRIITESITKQTHKLKTEMDELKVAKTKQLATTKEIKALVAQQRKGQAELSEKLGAREKIYATTENARKAKREKLTNLTKEAASLKELLGKIDASEKSKKPKPEKKDSSGDKKNMRSFANAKGKIHSPVAGRVVKHFGDETAKGDKGIVIETRTNATITSPFDGEVVFTGPFLNYGSMVIIRHSGDFHSLIAGIDDINTKLGEFLLEGEPIGAMGNNSAPQLYFELRKGKEPVDPAVWVAGL